MFYSFFYKNSIRVIRILINLQDSCYFLYFIYTFYLFYIFSCLFIWIFGITLHTNNWVMIFTSDHVQRIFNYISLFIWFMVSLNVALVRLLSLLSLYVWHSIIRLYPGTFQSIYCFILPKVPLLLLLLFLLFSTADI